MSATIPIVAVASAEVTSETASRLGPGNYRRIARIAGLTPAHVGRVLRGTRGASFHVGARIAVAAGVTLDQLYTYIAQSPELEVRGRRTVGTSAKVSKVRKARAASLARKSRSHPKLRKAAKQLSRKRPNVRAAA
jgi:transcriptional regulator with XRE-family HTH domain